jgi:hypothetical protein
MAGRRSISIRELDLERIFDFKPGSVFGGSSRG